MNGFLGNFTAGVVASCATVALLDLIRRFRLMRRYRPMEGRYRHFWRNGESAGDGVTEITHLGGHLLRTKTTGGNGDWEGRILMSEGIPDHGSGTYQYLGRADCGVHQIQRNASDGCIFVHGMNTSHGKDFVFALVWRPEVPSELGIGGPQPVAASDPDEHCAR